MPWPALRFVHTHPESCGHDQKQDPFTDKNGDTWTHGRAGCCNAWYNTSAMERWTRDHANEIATLASLGCAPECACNGTRMTGDAHAGWSYSDLSYNDPARRFCVDHTRAIAIKEETHHPSIDPIMRSLCRPFSDGEAQMLLNSMGLIVTNYGNQFVPYGCRQSGAWSVKDIVKMLTLRHDNNQEILEELGRLLPIAAQCGRLAYVREVLNAFPDIEGKSEALLRAALGPRTHLNNNQCAIIDNLLDRGAELTSVEELPVVEYRTGLKYGGGLHPVGILGDRVDGKTLLFRVVEDVLRCHVGGYRIGSRRKKMLIVVKKLLERGADMNRANSICTCGGACFGCTTLHLAVQGGHIDLVRLLLDHGAGAKNKNKNKASNEVQGGWTPLHMAAQENHLDVLQLLLERGVVNADQPDENSRSPLYIAAEFGHADAVQILLKHGEIDVNQPDKDHRTALYAASWQGHFDVVQILLEQGSADINQSDNSNRAPLQAAAQFGHAGVVRFLLEHGAADKDRALHVAARFGHVAVVKELIGVGANVDYADDDGCTALFVASSQRRTAVVKELIGAGARANLANNLGRMPFQVADSPGIAALLRQQPGVRVRNRKCKPTPQATQALPNYERKKDDAETPNTRDARRRRNREKQRGEDRKRKLFFASAANNDSSVHHPGVTPHTGGKWRASAFYDGEDHYLGEFDSQAKAAWAVQSALRSVQHERKQEQAAQRAVRPSSSSSSSSSSSGDGGRGVKRKARGDPPPGGD